MELMINSWGIDPWFAFGISEIERLTRRQHN
jgi:hypothetical protein